MSFFDEQRLSILRDVRTALIRMLAVCALLFFAILFFVEDIMRSLNAVIGMQLVLYSLPEAFMTYLKVALFVSVIVAVPYLIIEIVNLVGRHTALKGGILRWIVAAATLLFYGGAAFCYKLVLPSGIKFLLQYQTDTIKPMIGLSSYVSFVFTFLFVFGIMFELPLIMLILSRFGVVDVRFLNKNRRFFILMNAVVSALLTPTPDLFNMMLMMLPMQVLYEAGVVIVALSAGKLQKKADAV